MTGSLTLQFPYSLQLFSSLLPNVYVGAAWSELTHLDGDIGVHENRREFLFSGFYQVSLMIASTLTISIGLHVTPLTESASV